jgi:hypothetical protein
MKAAVRMSLQALRARTAQKLAALGFDPEETRCICEDVVRATGEGHIAHGVGALYTLYYLNQLHPGRGRIRVKTRGAGFIELTAPHHLGWLPAARAIDLLVNSAAAKLGPQLAIVRSNGFCGRLGHLTAAIARAGFVGIAMQATPPVLATPRTRTASLGTNPLAISVPAGGRTHPPTADVALSGVSFATEFLRVIVSKAESIAPAPRPRTRPERLALSMLIQMVASSVVGTELLPASEWGLVICTLPPLRKVGAHELHNWRRRLGLEFLPGERSASVYAQALRGRGVTLPHPIYRWLAATPT